MSTFHATIAIIGVNPYVRPPDGVLEQLFTAAGKRTSPIPIKGKINKASFRHSLVKYQGDWRLYVNIIMAKAAGFQFRRSIAEIVGKEITVDVQFDESPVTYTMIPLLQKTLDTNPTAKSNWEYLIPSRKKEVLRYLANLQSEEARQRNIEKVLKALSGDEIRFMGRIWRNGR